MQEVTLDGTPTKTIYAFHFSPMYAKQKRAVDKHNFHRPKTSSAYALTQSEQRLGVHDMKDFYSKSLLNQNS
jgi:hypothetical protein